MEWVQLKITLPALQAKESELISELRNREGLETEPEPEFIDEIQRAMDRAIVIDSLDRNSALLRDVRAAIERIAEGSYGLCLQCEEPISAKRLVAIPWAALCIHCQEQQDRENDSREPTTREFAILR